MRTLAVTITSLLLATTLAACGQGASADGSPTQQASPTAPAGESATAIAGTSSTESMPPPGTPITVLPPATMPSPNPTTTGSITVTSLTSASTPAPPTASPSSATDTPPPEPEIVETTVTAANLGPIQTPTGTVVVIDPGHNGGNGAHPEIINKQVDAGFGLTKACNTTGTSTNAGYSEHAFNWAVATALRSALEGAGVPTVMTRDSDSGVGPCINERAAIGNSANAAAVISIHGDGEPAAVNGFFIMTSSHQPGGPEVGALTDSLAAAVRDSLVAGGFTTSNSIGRQGLWARGDLGGLNLSQVPSVMIELGNMRNTADAATMSSPSGQQAYAQAIAAGVVAYLTQR